MAVMAAAVLAGCGSAPHAAAPTTTTPSGGNFMPLYLDTISGKNPYKDTCEVHTLEELLLPCDKKDG
jgi:hypothetical protein